MKTKNLIPRLAALVLGLFHATLLADADHKIVGPNKGRIITAVEPHAEFFVQPDRKVRITFLDDQGKAIPPAGRSVTVTAGDRAKPTVLKFAPQADALVSDVPLPVGDAVPAVVQIKANPGARMVVERFNVDLAVCPECKNPEYACGCHH